jgi:aspartate 1-decarboxylase
MRKFANSLIAILFFLIPLTSLAQTSISGRVINEKDGKAIEGATVIVKGSKSGTKTDANGNFTITVNKGDVLVISSVNFAEQQLKVKDNAAVVVRLLTKDGTLDEVVVTAMDIKKNPRD